MPFEGVINYPVIQLGVSQIYLNEKKVKAIEQWFSLDDMDVFEPLPVHDYGDGKYTLTDGHSRAYVAYKNGITEVPIIYDADEMVAGELGQILYRTDIEWCKRFSISDISHLGQRILSDDDYQRLWIERCNRSYYLLVRTTKEERKLLQSEKPELFLFGASEDLSDIYFENENGEIIVCSNEISAI